MHSVIKVDNCISRVLGMGKNLKSEILIIPRIITQSTFQSSLVGISYDSVITLSYFRDLTGVIELWEDKSLPYIALYTKDINEFLKVISDNSGDLELPSFEIDADEYCYGIGIYKIATNLRVIIKKKYSDSYINQPLPCISPYAAMNSILSMEQSITGGTKVVDRAVVTTDEKLRLIIDSKASFGAGIWIPQMPEIDPNNGPYYISLMPTLLNFSKGDEILFTLYDDLVHWTGSFFIAEFEVVKHKKRCTIKTQMLIMKIY